MTNSPKPGPIGQRVALRANAYRVDVQDHAGNWADIVIFGTFGAASDFRDMMQQNGQKARIAQLYTTWRVAD